MENFMWSICVKMWIHLLMQQIEFLSQCGKERGNLEKIHLYFKMWVDMAKVPGWKQEEMVP